MTDRNDLIHLLLEHSVQWGEFILASGAKSDFYCDVRRTALHDHGSEAIAAAVVRELLPEVEAVGGVELGAVPIVGSVITFNRWWSAVPRSLPGFIIRKKTKKYGLGNKIENCPPKGTKVAIIEDVTTTGGSLERAITAAEEAGLKVVQAIIVVDRQEGAEEHLRAGGYTGAFTPIVTRANLCIDEGGPTLVPGG